MLTLRERERERERESQSRCGNCYMLIWMVVRRQVSRREGEAMAKEFNSPFFETSAALRHNVEEAFFEIVRCIRNKENADYLAKKREEGGGGRGSGGTLSRLLCCSASDTHS